MNAELISIEMLARGAAIGAMLSMGIGLWRDSGGRSIRIASALFAASVIAYILNSSPQLSRALAPIMAPVHFTALGGTGLFWLFIVTLFEDRPVSWLNLSPWALLTGIGLLGLSLPHASATYVWVVHNLAEAGFSFHALYVVARSWRGDLVEARRRLRGPFLTLVTLFVITLSAFEIAESLGFFYPWFRLLGGASLAFYSVAGAIVFLQARRELFGAAAQATPTSAPAVDEHLDAIDRATLAKLKTLMDEGELWRREGLSIGALAEAVGVPEHRLRPLINDHLGYRNFAAFVNDRRIAAAKAMLADPANSRQTVAAIAYDLGFGSLGPFNRAFKDATGLTPTEFRKAAAARKFHA